MVAATQATTTIPIVFAVVSDPLRSGVIASYASSQNNVTGITNSAGPLSGKRLAILQEMAPGVKRVLVLVVPHKSQSMVGIFAYPCSSRARHEHENARYP
jgi:ABC-type uncharacterized transport system substrate-binding protein